MENKFKKISVKRLAQLLRSESKLISLECLGVDNWSGYDYLYDEAMNVHARELQEMKNKTDDEVVNEYCDVC